ncbi:MAG: hypothetical protein QOI12_3436 [Alphaproteobacteria bacterium]|jgi:hypothetical protein|nr:hypothetical protein [Alphaproteobacteria bacterium]
MRSAFRHGALGLALIGVVGLAAAGQIRVAPGAIEDEIALGPTFPDDETTGSIDRASVTQSLALSDEQRAWVFLGVMNLPDVREADVEPPEPATALEDTIELQDLPTMVTRKIPLLLDYKFVKLDDRILVVRPADRMVVAEIPRYRLVR